MFDLLICALLCCLGALCLIACGPDAQGVDATPVSASVVVMGQRIAEDEVTVEAYPECMGVAVAPTLVLTSDHCSPASVDGRHIIVTEQQWRTTTRASGFADSALVVGEVRSLVPRVPLLNWVLPAAPGGGAAIVVVVRGTEIVALPVMVEGLSLSGSMQEHGDSGAGVFQAGRLVGIVTACNSSNDEDCDLPGGRFAGVP